MRIKNLIYILLFAAIAGSFTSCEKDEFSSEVNLRRQFTPATFNIQSGETQVKITWNQALFTVPGKASYTVVISTDSLFQSDDQITKVTDTAGIVLTDEDLRVKQKYFAFVKVNGEGTTEDSYWGQTNGFLISGEQIFLPILPSEVRDRTAILRWRPSTGMTHIKLTPVGEGAAIEVPLTADDVAANFKLVEGLQPLTNYVAEVYQNTRLRGTIAFTTTEPSAYTVQLSPGDDLLAAITVAKTGDVIGLNPGQYDYSAQSLLIERKNIAILSTSGNPGDTKVLFKEFTLKGTGAGIKLGGIDFDGRGTADYFINLDAEAATFTSVVVENSIIHDTKNCVIRGNRGSSAGQQQIGLIRFADVLGYNNGTGYYYLTLDKLQFERLEVERSTFHNIGRGFANCGTALPNAPRPAIIIESTTMNNFGSGNYWPLVDANNNPVNLTVRNSIIANIPMIGGTVDRTDLVRAPQSTVEISNSNFFNLTTGATPTVAIVIPNYVAQSKNTEVNPGWEHGATDFTLPASSPLRTASTTGGAIGDPRWAR